MSQTPADEAFAQHILRSRMVSAQQIEAAEAERLKLAAGGQTVALSDVLVNQGVLTHAIVENLLKSMRDPPKAEAQFIGPYKLLKKIGEGGMGAVYLADDTAVGRQVALKILPKKYAGNAEFLKRFQREARAAGKLNHV